MEIPIWVFMIAVAIIGWFTKYFIDKSDAKIKAVQGDVKEIRELIDDKMEDVKRLVYSSGNEMNHTAGVILSTIAKDKDEVKEKINSEIKGLERYVSDNFMRKT